MSGQSERFLTGDRVMIVDSIEVMKHARGKIAVVDAQKENGDVLLSLEDSGVLGWLRPRFLMRLPVRDTEATKQPLDEPNHLVRRDMFIADLVALCRKYRVLLEVDDEDFDLKGIRFEGGNVDGMGFVVDMNDVESHVRMACWNLAKGVTKQDESES